MSQSGDDPSSSSPPFSTPPNEIYLAEKTITEGGIAKNISSTEETITTSSGAKINSLEEEPMTEKIIKTKEDNIETCTEGDNKLDESMNKNLASLDQQTPLEDKFKSFSEEDIDEELNEDMNHEEEKSKILQISQQQDDSPLPKTNNELLIDVSSQRMLRSSASPVIFFSPNNTKMPETSLEEGLNDSETLKSSNTLLITTTTSNIPCMKMSASIADLLPSRFPTEENEKKNKRGSKLETLAARQAKMVYSATFNNTFPNSSENIGKEKKMISQKPLEGASSGVHNNRGKNNTKNNIPAKVNTNRRTSLSKIFTNFRLQLEKTKTSFRTSSSADELKKTLITSNKRNYIPITRSFTTSLASPSTSSGSLDNYLRRRKNKSFLKKSVGKEEMVNCFVF
uniref:Uncharacterized protein n=1 Tax=Meloidogyne hapla TaxID=6305 RepID=A0A1I8BTB2_MELHA